MSGRILRTLAMAVVAWLCLAALAAAQPVGEMAVEQGQVKLRRAGRETVHGPEAGRVPLQTGDVLQTAKRTRAKLYFAGGDQVVSLFAGTVFTVRTVAQRGSFFRMALGKALFSVLGLLSTQRFEVETTTATIGVKGTEFVLGTDGSTKSYLLTLSGTVALRSLDFPDIEVAVGANQAAFARKGETPTPPVPVAPEVQQQILHEDGLDTMESVSAEAPPPVSRQGRRRRQGEQNGGQQDGQQQEEQGPGTSDSTTERVRDVISETSQTIQDTTETVTAPPTSNPFLHLGRGTRDIRITR